MLSNWATAFFDDRGTEDYPEQCDKCHLGCTRSDLVEYDGLLVCEVCLPICGFTEGGEICGEIADPSGDGCCSKHEAILNSEYAQ